MDSFMKSLRKRKDTRFWSRTKGGSSMMTAAGIEMRIRDLERRIRTFQTCLDMAIVQGKPPKKT